MKTKSNKYCVEYSNLLFQFKRMCLSVSCLLNLIVKFLKVEALYNLSQLLVKLINTGFISINYMWSSTFHMIKKFEIDNKINVF